MKWKFVQETCTQASHLIQLHHINYGSNFQCDTTNTWYKNVNKLYRDVNRISEVGIMHKYWMYRYFTFPRRWGVGVPPYAGG